MSTSRANLYHIYSPHELKQRAERLRSGEYLIEDFIPRQSISLVVGQSGEGKSPFLYQAMICVAAGIPFLGREVKKGRVLYMDCENGLAQVSNMIETISKHLRLPEPPPDLRLWNLNDPGETFARPGHGVRQFVKSEQPTWVVIDPLKTIFPGIDDKNVIANACYTELRNIGAEHHCAFTAVHHPRKPSNKPDERPPNLEKAADLREWFNHARGSLELINGCDVRIGIDKASTKNAAIVVRGFGRVEGEFPMMLLARETGGDGKPVGYRLLDAEDRLSEEQLQTLKKLPSQFKYTEARAIYGKSDNPTTQFLKKLQALDLVRHEGELYHKADPLRQRVLPFPEPEAA